MSVMKRVRQTAAEMLRSFGRNGQPVPMDAFVKQLLQPEGLTADDFKRFVRHDLVIQQLIQTMGLPGELVTPQEAAAAYEREHQEFSAQVVFFSASNYLSAVTVTPAAVAQFYTNYLAAYRLPDRVQVSYVEFNLSNYLAQAKAEWAKTNFEEVVEANYRQLGPDYFPDAKTPDAAKAKIRELLIRNRALGDARTSRPMNLPTPFLPLNRRKPENLATVAKQKGLTVHLTAPFASAYGPEEFDAPPEFTKAAFELTPDEPLAGPVLGPDARLRPRAGQTIAQRNPAAQTKSAPASRRITGCMRPRCARNAPAPILYNHADDPDGGGKNFRVRCAWPPVCSRWRCRRFRLSTTDLPELGDRAELNQLKQAAFTTPVGHASDFRGNRRRRLCPLRPIPIAGGPGDHERQMPQFIAQLRRAKQNEAFNQWLQVEANRELRNTPAYQPADSARRQINPGRKRNPRLRRCLRSGWRLKIVSGIKLSSPATREFWEIPVLFEDASPARARQARRAAHFARPLRPAAART